MPGFFNGSLLETSGLIWTNTNIVHAALTDKKHIRRSVKYLNNPVIRQVIFDSAGDLL
jgi:hypothetical protein